METHELDAMLSHDERHWWYRGRRRVLRAELDRLQLPEHAALLDAGCGSGRTLVELARYGDVSGIDASPVAVQAAQRRGFDDVRHGSVEELPFADESFDVVTCLDVIEHTPDDVRVLRELLRVTRPGGAAIITVPAHPALWSNHDVVNQHHRRYRRADLLGAARAAGYAVASDTYFNMFPLAPAAVVRWVQNRRPAPPARSDLTLTPAFADRALELPLVLEARLVALGLRVPAGLSLLAVLRRPVLAQEPVRARPIAASVPRVAAAA